MEDEEVYKAIAEKEAVKGLKKEFKKFRNPMVLGALIYRTVKERERAVEMLKVIMNRLDSIEARLKSLECIVQHEKQVPEMERKLLTETDEEILAFISLKEYVCAEEVKNALGYKGTNAASSRLNRLYERGLLQKKQVGRKVYFTCTKK